MPGSTSWRRATLVPIVFLVTASACHAFPAHSPNGGDDAPRYDLAIRLIPEAHRLEASGTVRLAPADAPRSEIRLLLSDLMRDFRVEVLRPAASAGEAKTDKERQGVWIVRLPRPAPAGEPVVLRFSYAGGGEIANQFYIGPEVCFASAWGTSWYPLAGVANDRGVGSLRFSAPAGYTVHATGIRRESLRKSGQGVFRFETVHPTYFSFAAGKYTVIRRNTPVPVSAYLLRPRPRMGQYLDGVARIIDALTREFGAYPFGEFALAEIPRELAARARFNAAAVQGFVLTNSRAFDAPSVDYLLEWYGHEFSHQWFPNTLALKTPPGLYMEEALAQYGGLRVVEALAGAEAAERLRRTGYAPDPIYSALEYFRLVAAGRDHRLSDLRPRPEHRDLAYNKGSLVFDMLSREIGRQRFRRILRGITRRFAFGEITWGEFLRAVEAGAGRDLRWFYEQWLERTGAPDYRLTWGRSGRRIKGAITQPAPYFRATLEVEVRGPRRGLTKTVEVTGGRTEFSWVVPFEVTSVALDPHYKVLRWLPEFRAQTPR